MIELVNEKQNQRIGTRQILTRTDKSQDNERMRVFVVSMYHQFDLTRILEINEIFQEFKLHHL